MPKHAYLSASASHRWLACPPSAKLCANIADQTSKYAQQGTDCHELCAYLVEKALGRAVTDPTENLTFYDAEMQICAEEYRNYVLEQIEAAKEFCKDPQVMIEQRLDFSRWVENGFGTGDCVIVADEILQIIDYKHGLGILVSAGDEEHGGNSQMMCYALGALEAFGDLYDIHQIKMTIFQPKNTDGDVATALKLRLQLAKSSVKKYQAMQNAVCKDGRAHGMFQFYGANRSGRWAGRLIQLQNLPQNHMNDLADARELVRTGDYDSLELLYDDIPDTLSQLIRTAFIARPGYKFVVSDYSAIEARVLAHLAGESWRSKIFAEGKDIYCASASQMFGVPVEKHGINSHLRQKGKIAELALGYGGSVGALISMGALDMGLTEDELQPLVDSWRASNPNITAFWWNVDNAVKTTIKMKIPTEVNGIKFLCRSGILFIKLPSGRTLSYVKPRIGENRFGGESVTYEGIGSTKKWERIESYGPKFVENIVQAVSRDLLCFAMRNLSHCFICGHVHDELIIECSQDVDYKSICSIMSRSPDWMPDILLRGDGYETKFYKKD